MGTPDAFIVDNLNCPACSRVPVRILQTKVFPHPYMDEIRLGDQIPLRTHGGDVMLDIHEGKVLCLGGCSGCDASFQYYAVIKDNK